jgi:hypothetical protein
MTGIHRDTIMRLGVWVGQVCEKLMEAKMRGVMKTGPDTDRCCAENTSDRLTANRRQDCDCSGS